MNPERWQQIERLYHAALECEPDARGAWLDEACAGDVELRREVASLLAYDNSPASFIAVPALEVAARQLAPLSEAQTQPLAPARIGAYQILSLLGRGGMGEVHLALDARLNRKVALKLLPAEFTAQPERVRRFAQEARAASSLNHPNIITIYEIGTASAEDGGAHYIVTEYVEGETLRQQMANAPNNRIKLAEAIDLAAQVAAALVAAHEAGIVHRDIKPENVMLRRDGYVKVLDFGLAKLIEESQGEWEKAAAGDDSLVSFSGVVMGTPRYMSPEQARGEKVDARTDIFSLGVMLFEMIVGRAPFVGATASEVIAAILRDSPPPLAECAPDAPPEMERILSRALRKERDDRYQTIKEFLVDLKNLTEERAFEVRSARQAALAPGNAAATTTRITSSTGQSVIARTSLSVGGLLSQIKTHKKSMAVILALLIIALAAIGYFTRRGDRSLAVLPVVNPGGGANDEYLSESMAEALINNLSQLPHLKVIGRSSAFQYRGQKRDLQAIGRELGVRAVFTISAMQHDDDLRVRAELVDVESKSQIWGEQYNVKLADIPTVQINIARQISEGLRVKITRQESLRLTKQYTGNTDANRFYTLGRYLWTQAGQGWNWKAIENFKLAIAQDPNYAPAYAGLAKTYGVIGLNGELPPKEAFPIAIFQARLALKMDDQLAEAHAALAGSVMFYERDWATVQRELQRSLDLNANDPLTHVMYSYFYTAMGRFDEAIEEVKRHQQLDPISKPMYGNMVRAYYFAGRYDEAIEANRKAIELSLDFPYTHLFAGLSYEQKGMYEEAIRELEDADHLLGGFPATLGALGHVYAVSGKRAEANKKLNELQEMSKQTYVSPLDLAILYAGLGDKEQTFEYLEKAYEDHSGWLINLKVEPRFDRLRSDPRFQDLLRRVGLTP